MRTPVTCLLLVCSSAATATGQQASYTFFGAGTACPMTPWFQVRGLPHLGTTIVVETERSCRGGCFDTSHEAWVLTGFSNTTFAGRTLPLSLPFACGALLTSVEAMEWTPSIYSPLSGAAEVPFAIPNHPALLGLAFYQQILVTWCWSMSGCQHWLSQGGMGIIGR